MILDSAYLIDLMQRDDGAVAKRDELVDRGVPLAVSTLTVFEVGTGVREGEEQAAFDSFVDRFTAVPVETDVARRAASLQRRLERTGDRIRKTDSLIAATALERNEPIVTRNVSEFDRVDELRVVPY